MTSHEREETSRDGVPKFIANGNLNFEDPRKKNQLKIGIFSGQW
jgi:hypothetical protein